MRMTRKHLFIVASIIWGIPGIIITTKGIKAYGMQLSENLWWLLLITVSVLAAFFMMGLGIALKHIPQIPSAFTASFYSGLGPMLLISAFRFASNFRPERL